MIGLLIVYITVACIVFYKCAKAEASLVKELDLRIHMPTSLLVMAAIFWPITLVWISIEVWRDSLIKKEN